MAKTFSSSGIAKPAATEPRKSSRVSARYETSSVMSNDDERTGLCSACGEQPPSAAENATKNAEDRLTEAKTIAPRARRRACSDRATYATRISRQRARP